MTTSIPVAVLLPVLLLAALIWVYLSACLSARPVRGTPEWIHRSVSPSFFTVAYLGIAGWIDYVMALVAAAAAFAVRFAFCMASVGFQIPETAVILRCVGVALGTGSAYYAVSQITDSRRNAWVAAVAAFALLSQADCKAVPSMIAPAFLALAPVNPVFFPVFGLFVGLAAVAEPAALFLLLPGLTTAILVQTTGKKPSAVLLWLLGCVLGAAVYAGCRFASAGSFSWPELSLIPAVTCSVTGAAVALITVVFLIVRICADRRFSDVFLLQALVFSIPCLLAGVETAWIYVAAAIGTAAHTILTRGTRLRKASLAALLVLLAVSLAACVVSSLTGDETTRELIRYLNPFRYRFGTN